MKTAAAPLLLVPFKEVRHEQPDDCLHYEPVAVRGKLHDWTIPAHRHEGLHQFQLLEKGGATATVDGVVYLVRAPAIMMLAPGSVHAFTYAANTAGHQVTLPAATLKAALAGAAQLESELGQSFVLDAQALGEDAAACTTIFEALAREFQGSAAGRVQSLMAHATLIAVWFLRHRGAQPADTRRVAMRDTLVQRLRALVERHYREHRPLSFYASALGVTPDHLSRACRAVTGQGALDLVHGRLMLEARRLLSYTPMSVADIACQLGYDDAGYFSKFFARCVGDPPTAYRESIHSGVRMREAQPLQP
ncbi:MAG: helix-turn-helix domain-containing protein [Burkholderiales bacterium]|nr:helix-turn-helix domain-containing protein [Burkholderiales bacterium]